MMFPADFVSTVTAIDRPFLAKPCLTRRTQTWDALPQCFLLCCRLSQSPLGPLCRSQGIIFSIPSILCLMHTSFPFLYAFYNSTHIYFHTISPPGTMPTIPAQVLPKTGSIVISCVMLGNIPIFCFRLWGQLLVFRPMSFPRENTIDVPPWALDGLTYNTLRKSNPLANDLYLAIVY